MTAKDVKKQNREIRKPEGECLKPKKRNLSTTTRHFFSADPQLQIFYQYGSCGRGHPICCYGLGGFNNQITANFLQVTKTRIKPNSEPGIPFSIDAGSSSSWGELSQLQVKIQWHRVSKSSSKIHEFEKNSFNRSGIRSESAKIIPLIRTGQFVTKALQNFDHSIIPYEQLLVWIMQTIHIYSFWINASPSISGMIRLSKKVLYHQFSKSVRVFL